MKLLIRFAHLLRKIPILGSLNTCTASDYTEAFKELFILLILSMAPIYLGALGLHIRSESTSLAQYFSCIREILRNGELFLYAAAVLAPVVYIVTRDRYNVRSFPSKLTFIVAVIVVTALASCIFMSVRVDTQILSESILSLSFYVFLISLVLCYFALVYNNTFLPNPASQMRRSESDFTKKLQVHRQKSNGGS